jgi:hypothetical protein
LWYNINMKYLKPCLTIVCVLILLAATVFWFLFFLNKTALLNFFAFPPRIQHRIFRSYPLRTVPPQSTSRQNIPKSITPSAATTNQTDSRPATNTVPEYPFVIYKASSTTPAKFKLIEKIDFNKFLGKKYQNITDRTYDAECGPGQVDAYEISYGDLTGDRVEEAVVDYYTCLTGTSGGVSEVYMLNSQGVLKEITPDLTKIPSYDKVFETSKGHEYFHIDNTTLIFDFPIYNEDDSNCCATGGKTTITFKWDGNKFIFDKTIITPMIYKGGQKSANTQDSTSSSAAASREIKNLYGPEEFSTSTSIFSSSTPDRQWLTCTDKGLGFSIDFPQGVDVMPAYRRINFGSAAGQFFWYSGVSVQGEGQTVDQFFRSASSRVSPADKLVLDSRLTIDREPALLYHEAGPEAGINRTAIVSHNNKIFVIDLNFTDSTTINIILHSFRFLQ